MKTTLRSVCNAELKANWKSREVFPLHLKNEHFSVSFSNVCMYVCIHRKRESNLRGRRARKKQYWMRLGGEEIGLEDGEESVNHAAYPSKNGIVNASNGLL